MTSPEGQAAPWQGRCYLGTRQPHHLPHSILVDDAGQLRPLVFVDKYEHERRYYGTDIAPHEQVWEWGYLGTGPADTAASILADHFGGEPQPLAVVQRFKEDFVASLPRRVGSVWTIRGEDIARWLALPAIQTALAAGWEAVRLHEADEAELARLAKEAGTDAAN